MSSASCTQSYDNEQYVEPDLLGVSLAAAEHFCCCSLLQKLYDIATCRMMLQHVK
jgi:hypothetical protein